MGGNVVLVRWSGAQPIDRESILRELGESAFDGTTWANGPRVRYAPHAHSCDKILIVLEGSIEMILPLEDTSITLAEGDRLELPANTLHAAVVGGSGVVCWEARRPRGSGRGEGGDAALGA